MPTSYEKDPNAKGPYKVDWKYRDEASRAAALVNGWLDEGETITNSTWVVASGITQSTSPASSNVDGLTTIWLEGGTLGQTYRVTNRITTSAGRIDERSFTVLIVDR